MKRTVLMLVIVMMFSNSAWAEDIVAIWKDKNANAMKLSYRDDTQVRMEMHDQGYMLVTKEKVYMVTHQNEQWQAVDMDQMAGLMKAFGQGASETIADEIESAQDGLKDSGRTEVIAGYKGKVYLMEEEQSDGSMKEVEIVLSPHADLKKINRAWMAISTRMGKLFGQEMAQSIENAIKESKQKDYGGLLRYSDQLKLESIRKEDLGESYFNLPKDVTLTQIPKFSTAADGYGDDTPPSADNSEAATTPVSSKETSAQDDNGKLKEEINKGVRKLFKKLF